MDWTLGSEGGGQVGTWTSGSEGRGVEIWVLHSWQEDAQESLFLALGEEGLELRFKFPGGKGLEA